MMLNWNNAAHFLLSFLLPSLLSIICAVFIACGAVFLA